MLYPALFTLSVPLDMTWRFNFQWLTGQDSAPVNLAGWYGEFLVRENSSDSTNVAMSINSSPGLKLDSQGGIEINVSRSLASALDYGEYWYEINLSSDQVEFVRLLRGPFKVMP